MSALVTKCEGLYETRQLQSSYEMVNTARPRSTPTLRPGLEKLLRLKEGHTGENSDQPLEKR